MVPTVFAAVFLGCTTAFAQHPIMRPVPRTAEVQRAAAIRPSQRPAASNLKWRRSPNAAPAQTQSFPASDFAASEVPAQAGVAADVFAEQRQQAQPQAQRQPQPQLQVVQTQPELRRVVEPVPRTAAATGAANDAAPANITPAAYMTTPQRPASLLDNGLQDNGAGSAPRSMIAQNTSPRSAVPNDYFNDPFGDDPLANPSRSAAQAMPQTPVMAPQSELSMPNDLRSGDFRSDDLPSAADSADDFDIDGGLFDAPEMETPELQAPPASDAASNPELKTPDSGPQLRDLLRDNMPQADDDSDLGDDDLGDNDLGDNDLGDEPDELPAPDNRDDDLMDNPFKNRADSDSDDRDRDDLDEDDLDAADRDRLNSRDFDDDGTLDDDRAEMNESKGLSCSDFRDRIRSRTIQQVSLDISAPYRPDEIDEERYAKLKAKFDEKQTFRQWRTIDGMPLASGRLRDLAYEKAIIETEFGSLEELSINRLSEADLAYINENWGLPQECLLEQVAYAPRQWTPMTMTWKAPNLCHNPLYFQDVNLERYGHTHGPVLEPIVQTAHFFGNIAILPYKMGIHPPTECQYPLGYYRPGNCAPWIKPPVPLSLRGAASQAAVMTGMFWLIP